MVTGKICVVVGMGWNGEKSTGRGWGLENRGDGNNLFYRVTVYC